MAPVARERTVPSGAASDLSNIVAEISSSVSGSVDALTRSNDRRDSLEATVETLDTLLSQISLGFISNGFDAVDAFSFNVRCGDRRIYVRFTDISVLADFLFEELERVMQNLPSFVGSAALISLLRCCVKIITLLGFDNGLALEKSRVLLSMISKLRCPERASMLLFGQKDVVYMKESMSREYLVSSGVVMLSCFEVCNARVDASVVGLNLLCPMLEVFLDELLNNRDFKKYLMAAESVSAVDEKLLVEQFAYSDARNVLELVSAHFLLSFCDESAFMKFTNRLFWSCSMCTESSEISLSASMLLLGTVLNFAPPNLLGAHVILLVSESIGIHMKMLRKREDIDILLNSWFTAFEVSVFLYVKHFSLLDVKTQNFKVESIFDFWEIKSQAFGFSSFGSCVQPVTCGRIHLKTLKFEDSYGPSLHKDFLRSDLMSASISYLEDIKHMFDPSCSKEMYAILKRIIFKCLSESSKDNCLYRIEEKPCEIASYLAALLKLMGCSLLQIVRYVRGCGNPWGLKTLKDYAVCKEYDFIIGIISSFKHGRPEVGNVVSDATGRNRQEHKNTKQMIFQFSQLLLLCYNRGPEFLWKGCIFMLMVLMNLLVFEEGNLDTLKSILEQPPGYCFPRPCKTEIHEGVVHRSSLAVASNIMRMKLQTLRKSSLSYVSKLGKIKDTRFGRPTVSAVSCRKISKDVACTGSSRVVASSIRRIKKQVADKSENSHLIESQVEDAGITCNGKAFLESVLHSDKRGEKPGDYEELANFIVCKKGKDYSTWLKSRGTFRAWRYEKVALQRKQRNRNLMALLSSGLDEETVHAMG